VKLPLRRLNKKLERVVEEAFGYTAGRDIETPPPLVVFEPEDEDIFSGDKL
jgi:hypothetical protein